MSFRLEARGLDCERDGQRLFAGLGLSVADGDCLLVSGPNGSGKSTLLRMLAGQLPPQAGELAWCGRVLRHGARALRANLLYMGHAPGVAASLTPLETLAWYQALRGERGDDDARLAALEDWGLGEGAGIPAGQLSAGQRRRVALARLTLTSAPLWLLDEPFTALDRDAANLLEERLSAHVRAGGAVVLASHHVPALTVAMSRLALGESPRPDEVAV
ncbi:cytochrome c biogenesis heme-transporting ATPase CcmA [Modicisalibacter radicis]|uniref:cytochrome c biogenesis heme-transporting ATPase CcmA n=1 Tax=Halomonas sp. EAR18 TaxID=2518972 RepID=UPI00109C2A64|nr:cytochrome c biogenesis heme-transporting ATPase CcmA [Halomonas sp. EAR18]